MILITLCYLIEWQSKIYILQNHSFKHQLFLIVSEVTVFQSKIAQFNTLYRSKSSLQTYSSDALIPREFRGQTTRNPRLSITPTDKLDRDRQIKPVQLERNGYDS